MLITSATSADILVHINAKKINVPQFSATSGTKSELSAPRWLTSNLCDPVVTILLSSATLVVSKFISHLMHFRACFNFMAQCQRIRLVHQRHTAYIIELFCSRWSFDSMYVFLFYQHSSDCATGLQKLLCITIIPYGSNYRAFSWSSQFCVYNSWGVTHLAKGENINLGFKRS